MKKKTRVAALALTLVLGTGTAALAAGNLVNIAVNPGMKLSIDGEAFVPTDVNGKEVDVFAYNGTTYVPIRAISEAFGKAVSYDASTQTAVIQSVLPPYDPDQVDYVLSVAPETYTDENGNPQTWYNGVGYEFRWWLPEEQQNSFTVKQVSGQLPDGITLVGDHLVAARGAAEQLYRQAGLRPAARRHHPGGRPPGGRVSGRCRNRRDLYRHPQKRRGRHPHPPLPVHGA